MPHPPHTHSHSQILPQESLFHKPEFHSPLTPIIKLSSEKGKLSSISPSWDHTPIEWKKKKKPPSFRVSHGFKPQFSTYHFYDPRQSTQALPFPKGRKAGTKAERSVLHWESHSSSAHLSKSSWALTPPWGLLSSFSFSMKSSMEVASPTLTLSSLRIGTRSSIHASNF